MTEFSKKFIASNLQKGPLKGARILAAAFPSKGVVSIAGSIAGGARVADMLGVPREVPGVHAALLMEGTKRRTKRNLALALDSLGASVSFGASADRLTVYAQAPAASISKVLMLITEMLGEPAFPAAELAALKLRSQAQLAHEAEDPRVQANILLSRALYPKGHLNFAETTDESRRALLKITAADLRRYHTATMNAGTLILAGAGDLDPKRFVRETAKHFSRLSKTKGGTFLEQHPASELQSELSTVGLRVLSGSPPARVLLKTIPGKASIDYFLGAHLGITDAHPDYPAVMLALRVLGNRSGFTGRLMQEVREKEGLTYGVYSYPVGFDGAADGYAAVWGTFAPELFHKGRAAVRREVEKLIREGASEEEVRKHAALYAAQSEVRMNDSGSYASAAHDTLADGRPLSYLDEFPERVKKLSREEVNDAIKKYLDLSKMSETAAGPVEKGVFR